MCEIQERIWTHIKSEFDDLATDRTKRDKVHFKRKIFKGLSACKANLADIFELSGDELQCYYTNKGKKTNTEYMGFDFTWTTYPSRRQFHYKTEEMKWPTSAYRILLAAECEAASATATLKAFSNKVLEDFIKLLDVKSDIKIMVYRPPLSKTNDGFEIIQQAIGEVIQRHHYNDCSEKWLFIGIPWYKKKFPRFGPTCSQVSLLSSDCVLIPAPWPI